MCYLGNIRKSCMGLAVLCCTLIVHFLMVLYEDSVAKMDQSPCLSGIAVEVYVNIYIYFDSIYSMMGMMEVLCRQASLKQHSTYILIPGYQW